MQADLGDQVPEALQEGVDLGLDGGGHAVPRHQVHILPLVLLCHPAPIHTLCSQPHTVIPEAFPKLTALKQPPPVLTLLEPKSICFVHAHANLPYLFSYIPLAVGLHLRVHVHAQGRWYVGKRYGNDIATQSFCTCRTQGA